MRVEFIDVSTHKRGFTYGSELSAGIDLPANRGGVIYPGQRLMIDTGLKIAIEEPGVYARIAPRSGLALRHGIDVMAGVVDADYRDQIRVILINHHPQDVFTFEVGDRIAQLIFTRCEHVELVEASSLSQTQRGTGGFGSTGV